LRFSPPIFNSFLFYSYLNLFNEAEVDLPLRLTSLIPMSISSTLRATRLAVSTTGRYVLST